MVTHLTLTQMPSVRFRSSQFWRLILDIYKEVNPRFEDFIFDWNYKTQLCFGGYGSSKSYHIALKIILKCLTECRKILVVREVYETIRESCFDLFEEILDDMDLLADENQRVSKTKVISKSSPMMFRFPNGSRIIFKGLDKPRKLKSINGISIVWIEEAAEVKYEAYKELVGRLRDPKHSLHIILSWNPVDESNWTFKRFFIDRENNNVFIDPEVVYKNKTISQNNVYYHHSVALDNKFLPQSYLDELQDIRNYDPDLYRVAWLGRYGINGMKVLPQLVRMPHKDVIKQVQDIPEEFKFTGMDFGFETSYNAVVRMAVDDDNKILYVYDEYYKNKMTDVETAKELASLGYKDELIIADSEDPKAIRYYVLEGFRMKPCKKYAGSRIGNTRKLKRFKSIVISSECVNCWRELKDLTYKKDADGNLHFDEFNIDPHTFSAMWYGLDKYDVADIKYVNNSKRG